MSFVERLRQSRSRPVAVIHKFLLSYDPQSDRTHAFVEGASDLAFYRNYLEQHMSSTTLRIYNCEGKANVYEICSKIVERFPACRRVVFFVDKDIDDILGAPWRSDPRIYVTDLYSVENYLVCKEVVRRFFSDFVKLKRVDVDLELILPEFDRQLASFHQAILPVMGWVVSMRRAGASPILKDVDPGAMLSITDEGVERRGDVRMVQYLARVTNVNPRQTTWRQILQTCRELRRLEAKRFVRGKFEAWFLLAFMRRVEMSLSNLAREAGGSISVGAQLSESNFIQILVHALPAPTPLSSFLEFHFDRVTQHSAAAHSRDDSLWHRARIWLGLS